LCFGLWNWTEIYFLFFLLGLLSSWAEINLDYWIVLRLVQNFYLNVHLHLGRRI
jgi:hypothetical protein